MKAEQIVQRLPRRCPYCDEVLPEPELPGTDVKEERCPRCGKVFMRVPWRDPASRAEASPLKETE